MMAPANLTLSILSQQLLLLQESIAEVAFNLAELFDEMLSFDLEVFYSCKLM